MPICSSWRRSLIESQNKRMAFRVFEARRWTFVCPIVFSILVHLDLFLTDSNAFSHVFHLIYKKRSPGWCVMSIAFYNRPLSSSKQFTYSGHTGQSSSGKRHSSPSRPQATRWIQTN
ncbi:hypothetical protein OUZ56_019620 [Daphnia magna]|uniref:Uncharacterized protein n=1 Tax=Daphnia magna TaxID=35525 RepID=A0ABQ9ZC40_9CRUS|nr:hypothetical protein OUZ56_019620 [Daphnia magna]